MKRPDSDNGISGYTAKRSAQSYLRENYSVAAANGSCGSSCGAGNPDEKPENPKPSACSSACGTGDK